jgi:type I restriction enzyme S subunit
MPKISQGHIKSWRVVVPTLKEQRAILESTEAQLNPINAAVARARSEVSLLSEYRTRLFADVVIGKLDVREAAAQLPDEADEAELLDEVGALTGGDEDAADDLGAVTQEDEV